MCQKTPSLPWFSLICSTAAMALFTPRNWWFLATSFVRSPLRFVEDREVLHEVQELPLLADAPDHRLQADEAGFLFVVNLLPFGEVLQPGRHAADPGFRAVGQDDDGVVPEHLRDGVLVVGQVLLVGEFELLVGCLQFDEDERNAVHEADQIGTLLAVVAGNPELRGEEEVVVLGFVPVDQLDDLDGFFFVIVVALL